MEPSMSGTSIDNLRALQNNSNTSNSNRDQNEGFIRKGNTNEKQDFDIDELTRDINDNIPDDTFVSITESVDDEKTSTIPFGWKEPLLLLLVYLLMSQAIVRQTAGTYIKQLNPGPDGTVGFIGVLIYGILLVTIYFILKKLLI